MKLSEDYKKRIISMFGNIGKDWLETIPGKIDKYVEKFSLKNIRILDNLTYNVVIFAENEEFGQIVLKIEIPFKEVTIRESQALIINNGIGACKCHYSNVEDGVILLERLLPGNTLNSITDMKEKIKIFKDVAKKFNVNVTDKRELPTYREILDRSLNMVYENTEQFAQVKDLIELASSLYEQLQTNEDDKYLLHSDLYSDNILKSGNEWKAIDPHGFIGEKELDTAIFIQKELEKSEFDINSISKVFGLMNSDNDLDLSRLGIAFFINYVLNICWDIEVHLGEEHTKTCVERANMILDYLVDNYNILNINSREYQLTKKNVL